mmetsp:Transcript_27443/g.37708  ORF Transcript_27443/g.37708 Transcript_27443/m.37708 type:complete len:219 (-) Transcript_27443:1758-2414(-)
MSADNFSTKTRIMSSVISTCATLPGFDVIPEALVRAVPVGESDRLLSLLPKALRPVLFNSLSRRLLRSRLLIFLLSNVNIPLPFGDFMFRAGDNSSGGGGGAMLSCNFNITKGVNVDSNSSICLSIYKSTPFFSSIEDFSSLRLGCKIDSIFRFFILLACCCCLSCSSRCRSENCTTRFVRLCKRSLSDCFCLIANTMSMYLVMDRCNQVSNSSHPHT